MLAAQDQNIDQAASSVWQLMQDFEVREQIRRREANERYYNAVKEKADRADELEASLKELKKENQRQKKENERQKKENARQKKENAELKSMLSAMKSEMQDLKSRLDEK